MAAAPPPDTPQPAPAKRSGCFGCGCGGCLVVVIVIALLIGGGGWWFFVVQASAAVTAPASLVVINQPITVDGNPGTPGQSLNAGSSVATGTGGHGAINFPDGSFMRLAPNTTVQINSVKLQKNGNLQTIALEEKVGRTFTNVQHLANGANFTVSGHSVTAAVRGTQFEILVRPDHTNRIWVFVGKVEVQGKTSLLMTAGQELDIDANGSLGSPRSSTFDPTDPFPMAQQCAAAISNGNGQGTAAASYGDPITGGQSAESDYYSSGGRLTVALCYPGSTMSVTVTDPSGNKYTKQGAPPVTLAIPSGPPGLYRAVVTAVNVPASGEAYSVAFATDAPCSADSVDTGSVVREALSSTQISNLLAQLGTTGVTIYVSGTSPTSARIVYYTDAVGAQIGWIIDFYAATPALGAVITEVTLHGISVTTQLISTFSSMLSHAISSIPSGFVVDRVYSCASATGDNLMVVEATAKAAERQFSGPDSQPLGYLSRSQMAAPAKPLSTRRGGRRFVAVLGILVVIIAGVVIWLNISAQAQVDASGMLTVYQPSASIAHGSGVASPGATGALVRAGDTISTDTKGLAGVTLPDGTLTRIAPGASITFGSAHFNKNGTMHDVSLTQQAGRTFTNVQHLVTGASFDVHGKPATASVRGTKFEVLIDATGAMTVKVFEGTVFLHNANGSVTINAGQQATASADGTLGTPGPIVPDPNDPFGPALDASTAVSTDTTPGTEQDFIGPPLHVGEKQTYTYSYAGGTRVEAALGYPGSQMMLTLKSPDGQSKSATGKLPLIRIENAPAGIYTIVVDGVKDLGANGEEPFVAVASVEQCASDDTERNAAVHRAYTARDLISAVEQSGQVSGLSNLSLTLEANSIAGAIITASGTYNGVGWSGSVVLVAHDGVLDIMPTSGTVFGLNVPAQKVVQGIASVIGQDPSNINPGFIVDRLFTCNSVLIVDGRTGA